MGIYFGWSRRYGGLGNGKLPEFTVLNCVDRTLNRRRRSIDAVEVVRRQFEDRNPTVRKILLVADVLVRGDEEVELAFSQTEQLTIFYAAPSALLRGGAFVTGQEFVHRPRNALVEKDVHVTDNEASERSRRRQAISRVTEGKHSRNSSSV